MRTLDSLPRSNSQYDESAPDAANRLRQKFGTAFEIGKRAVGTLTVIAPHDQLRDYASRAALETGKAGAKAVLHYVMDYYGLENRLDQASGKDRLRIADSYKLGHHAMNLLTNPTAQLSRLATGSLYVARGAIKQEVTAQATTLRHHAAQAATSYVKNTFAA